MAQNPSDLATYQSDHDLLIELRTEMRGVRTDIQEIKTNTVARVSSLENDRLTKKEVGVIRDDIDNLKLWRAYLVGAWAVSSFIITLILIPLALAYFA